MHVLVVVRAYLGLTQTALAKSANITQADLCEMETKEPYGQIAKYQRVSRVLGIPVEAILKDDFTAIPMSFFETHPAPEYTPVPKGPDHLLGRQGEDFVFEREQKRVAQICPALAKLVIPWYKIKKPSPGYDILSFDRDARPYFIEVKTSYGEINGFRLTRHEMDTARGMTAAGENYTVCCISNWDSPDMEAEYMPFGKLLRSHNIAACHYYCTPIKKPTRISGLAYHRQKMGLKQSDMYEALGIVPCDWSLYETGKRSPSVGVYLKASTLLDATVDELLEEYDVREIREDI